jgi:hypothetical protein
MTYYELTQRQRAYERSIRARRRDAAAASGIVDGCAKRTPEYNAAYRDFQAASIKLRDMRTAYSDFSKSVGLLTRNERTQAYGFDRSISAKAVWAVRNYEKELDKYKQVRYNDDGTIVVTDDWTKEEHRTVPRSFKPNAIVETINGANRQTNRTFYDGNGIKAKEVHSKDHGLPKTHPSGAHAHQYNWTNENGKYKSNRVMRDLTPQERIENGDIL